MLSTTAKNWHRFSMALTALLVSAVCAAAPVPCEGPLEHVQAPYSVSCAGKSECLTSDQLEIKPIDSSSKPLVALCLRLGLDDKLMVRLDLYRAPTTSQVPMSYPLAPIIERWLRDAQLGAALRSANRARLPIDVVLVDSTQAHYEVPLVFDLSSLWSNGSLPLNISEVSCNPCKFDDLVSVSVPDLATWKLVTKADPAKLSIVLSGTRLPGITPTVSTIEGKGQLGFRLQRFGDKPESVSAWNVILRSALAGDSHFTVGLADDKGVLVTSEKGGEFAVANKSNRLGYTIVFGIALLLVLYVIGHRTSWEWVRDSYGIPDNLVPANSRSFSLGRCQMLWWTLIVAVSWFAIGYATGDWVSINESCLILLGISVGTAVGAVAATPDNVARLVKAYADAKIAASGNAADPALVAAKAAITGDAQIRTRNPLADLLSDYGESAGLHRLQNVAFTVIFGGWFVWLAFSEGAMPTLSNMMLTLMGISGSAYVGFKLAGK